MKIVPYVKSNTSTNVYDTHGSSSASKPFAKFNIKTLSDDDSDYKPANSYSRSTTTAQAARKINNNNFSDSSDDERNNPRMASSRSAQVRRNTKTLTESELRGTSKSAGKK